MSLRISYQWSFLATACAVAGLFTPILANAQSAPGGSGGGKVVVCYTNAKKKVIKTVELLDLWEGERLPPYRKAILSNSAIDTQVAAGIERLRYTFDFSYSGSIPETPWDVMTMQGIKWTTDFLLGKQSDSDGWAIDPIFDGKLPPTEDSYEQVLPTPESNCELDQVIRFEPDLKRIRINMRLLRAMKKTHVAALYLHEGLYSFAKSPSVSSEKSSIRVRRAVSFVMGGNAFSSPPTHSSGEKYVECISSNFDFKTIFDVGRDAKGAYINPKKVAGIAVIGYNKNYLRHDMPIDDNLAKCIEQVMVGDTNCQTIVGFYDSTINNGLLFLNNDVSANSNLFVPYTIRVRSTPDHLHDGATDSIKCTLQTY